jgi:hypothetical protein
MPDATCSHHARQAGPKARVHFRTAQADLNPSGQPNPSRISLLMGHSSETVHGKMNPQA